VVCDEVDECDDSVEVCEDDSLDEIENHEHEKIYEKCQTLNDLTLVVEIYQLLQTSVDENDDSLEICEIFHEVNDSHDDEKIEIENDPE
jgi:hypothetical protein